MGHDLLRIGELASATGLSVKALRYYQRVGLLSPARVDPDTGYRYYDTDNLEVAHTIAELRAIGMGIRQIEAALQQRGPALEQHQVVLQRRIGTAQASMARLAQLSGAPIAVVSREEPPILGASYAVDSALERLALDVPMAFGALLAHAAAQGLSGQGPLLGLARHVSASGGPAEGSAVRIELVLPTAAPPRCTPPLHAVTIGGGLALVAEHTGHHAGVFRVHGAIARAAAREGLRRVGPPVERYQVGPRDTPDVAAWRTEVVWWVA